MAASLEALNTAWDVVSRMLTPGHLSTGSGDTSGCTLDFTRAMDVLCQGQLAYIVEEWFMERVQQDLRQNVAPRFWQEAEAKANDDPIQCFSCAVETLYQELSQYKVCIDRLESVRHLLEQRPCTLPSVSKTLQNRNLRNFTVMLYKAVIFHSIPKYFHTAINNFYSKAFKVFHLSKIEMEDESEEERAECLSCGEPVTNCRCTEIINKFHTVNSQLGELGLLEKLSGAAITSLVHQRIQEHISETCQGNFEISYLDTLEKWLDDTVLEWLHTVYTSKHGSHGNTGNDHIQAFRGRLLHLVYDTYARIRIDLLFNIIIEYPDSEPALQDLRACLEKTDLRGHLTTSLRSAVENRLLHPGRSSTALLSGAASPRRLAEDTQQAPSPSHIILTPGQPVAALTPIAERQAKQQQLPLLGIQVEVGKGVNTADILTAYISAIRALRVLDPAGVILELVCEPVRKYLRSRADTVRCVVSSLTDEGSNELSDELIKAQPLILEDTSNSDDEGEDWTTWMPDPVDADSADASKSRRASDIISMLVNIYGSKELFVNEYRTLLADRILTQFNYETGREIRYLELLKLMFGDAQLHYCEVMLKDVADSRRINGRITEERKKSEQTSEQEGVNAMILSAQFWPSFRDEKITLPAELQQGLEEYTKQYEALKGNRTLSWKPHLGLLNIDVELKDRTLNFTVSPLHAAIIMQFQNQVRWSVEDLSGVLQMPVSALRRKITYWQSQGLLREETPDVFVLIEEHKGPQQEVMLADEEEAESAMASAHAQREEQFQVFWSYIVGMLTSLESLTLERIHSMLKMFAMQGPSTSEFTLAELKAFLDSKIKQQQLVASNGIYRLAK